MESEVWDIRVSIRGIHPSKRDIRGQNGAFVGRFGTLTTPTRTFEGENGALASKNGAFIRPNRSFEGENGALAHSNKKGFEKSEAFMNQFII